jgi:hypothetical protein
MPTLFYPIIRYSCLLVRTAPLSVSEGTILAPPPDYNYQRSFDYVLAALS